MSWLECRTKDCGRPRSATVTSEDGDHIPECRSCGDKAYIETYDVAYGQQWDDITGYITVEYDIDENLNVAVFHLEREDEGTFTGYWVDIDVLKPENQAEYSCILNQMVADFEAGPRLPSFSIEERTDG